MTEDKRWRLALIGYLILAVATAVALFLVVQQADRVTNANRNMINTIANLSYEDCQGRNELRQKFDDPGQLEDCNQIRAEYLALLDQL
jgi:hypothetical protein